jgi:hypothetical protein
MKTYQSVRFMIRSQVRENMLEDTITKPVKSKRGGYRPNSGRKPGSRNLKSIQKEERLKREVAAKVVVLSEADVSQMSAVSVLRMAMHSLVLAEDLTGAASIAEKLAPYESPRISAATMEQPLAADMEPDPETIGDDPEAPPAITGDRAVDDERMAEYYRARVESRREAGADLIE